jgi:hypothetical protein
MDDFLRLYIELYSGILLFEIRFISLFDTLYYLIRKFEFLKLEFPGLKISVKEIIY